MQLKAEFTIIRDNDLAPLTITVTGDQWHTFDHSLRDAVVILKSYEGCACTPQEKCEQHNGVLGWCVGG